MACIRRGVRVGLDFSSEPFLACVQGLLERTLSFLVDVDLETALPPAFSASETSERRLYAEPHSAVSSFKGSHLIPHVFASFEKGVPMRLTTNSYSCCFCFTFVRKAKHDAPRAARGLANPCDHRLLLSLCLKTGLFSRLGRLRAAAAECTRFDLVLYVSMEDMAAARVDASGDLVLGEHRISAVYVRRDAAVRHVHVRGVHASDLRTCVEQDHFVLSALQRRHEFSR
eukprot:6176469-Pleurochrysis_carterae.AAC.1